jgi:hypothetical protein
MPAQRAKMAPVGENLVLVFIPALAPLLLRAEQEKGSPLTEQEVLAIRDAASCVAVPEEAARAIYEERGYEDIDPDHCWQAWQQLRLEFSRPDEG